MTPSPQTIYFASTRLDLRQTDKPDDYLQDVFVKGVCYRKVDPPYLAWLRRQMESAKRQHAKGKLSQAAWDVLRAKFNLLQEWAVEYYGAEQVREAVRTFEPKAYRPPVNRQPTALTDAASRPFNAHQFPTTDSLKFYEPVTEDALAKVNAIREAAQDCGWTEARLYQNRGHFTFPHGQEYGLVCFIDPTDALGEVTPTYIEIIHHNPDDKHVVRFHNSDVFPPRITSHKQKVSVAPDTLPRLSVCNQ